jgi:hypothetical protein
MGIKLGKVVAGLGAAAAGYMQGSEMYRRREREEREDAERQEDRTRRRAAEDRETTDRIELANAIKPVAVEQPNDVLGDDEGNAMPAVPAFRAGGQRFDTAQQAQAAANAANTPEAVQARIASANVSDPTKVLTLQNAVMAQGNAQRESRNAAFRDALGEAMAGGHEGLAGFATKFEHGPFKGKAAKVTVSADGKTATYNVLQDDGTLKPVFSTTNDENGIREAGFRFDRLVTPAQRAEFAMKLSKEQREIAKEGREGKETDSKIALNASHARYYDTAGRAMTTRAEGAASGSGKPYKMDEDDKLAFTDANARVRTAEENVTKAMANLAGADPAKDPGVQFAQRALAQAKRHQFQTAVRVGQITPEAIATDVLGAAKSPQEVLASLTELATTVGPDFADKVGAMVQGSDAWKQMNRGRAQPRTGAGRAAAEAPPGSVTLDPSGRYVPTAASGAAPVTLESANRFTPLLETDESGPRDPNFPGGRLRLNLPLPGRAANVPVLDPSVYDRNFRR